ncbi:MAG: 3-oxoacyl-ACP reductase FabG [Anaerolineae bacterium]|nr:3-oxoacyl-ACP reductase FabG [Anaerolineae bacterium]
MQLKGKIAMVTGASRGIGRGIAERLGAEGARVAVVYRSRADEAEAVVDAIARAGGEARAWRCDVTRKDQVDATVASVAEAWGGLDILVNNAGGKLRAAPFFDITEELWDECLDLNLKGVFLCSQAAARVMARNGGGRIINIASISSVQAQYDRVHYCTAKGGLIQLTRTMALELAPHRITVNAVGPTTIETDATRDRLSSQEAMLTELRMHPLGRLGQPEDVAAGVVFFCLPETGFYTGQLLLAEGGNTLVR